MGAVLAFPDGGAPLRLLLDTLDDLTVAVLLPLGPGDDLPADLLEQLLPRLGRPRVGRRRGDQRTPGTPPAVGEHGQMCSVEMCPCRTLFSWTESSDACLSGKATSISRTSLVPITSGLREIRSSNLGWPSGIFSGVRGHRLHGDSRGPRSRRNPGRLVRGATAPPPCAGNRDNHPATTGGCRIQRDRADGRIRTRRAWLSTRRLLRYPSTPA